MKKNFWLVLGVLLSTSALADQATVSPASTNAMQLESSATNAPGARTSRPARRTAARRPAPAPELRTEPLVAGPAVVSVGAGPVNVRGKAGLAGEVIARVTNGEPVTVIEEVTLKNSKANEPSAWAKIALPEKAHGWVKTSYIDPANQTVTAKPTLNLRAGPGENYSVLGTLQFGDPVKEIERKDNWIKIETPSNAYAFVAARYLKQEPTMLAVTPTPEPTPTPTPTPVSETPTVGPATNELAMAGMTNMNEMAMTNEMTSVPAEPVVEEPLPPRIIQHEGIVWGTVSIQAPTRYALVSPETRKTINYLYTTSTNLDLSQYKGMRIIVTGEEGLDERWKNTPVITIHRIQVLE